MIEENTVSETHTDFPVVEFNHFAFAALLRRLRMDARFTTSDTAKVVGIKSRKTWENWEKSIGQPSVFQYFQAGLGMGYRLDELTKMVCEILVPEVQPNPVE